jgi:hypothetical protein
VQETVEVGVSFPIAASPDNLGGDSSQLEIPTFTSNDHLVVGGDSVSETAIVAKTEMATLLLLFAASAFVSKTGPLLGSATQAAIPLPSTAPFTPSDVLLNEAIEVLSFSVETLSASITVSESLEETVDSAGSRIVIVHTFSVHVAVPIYTRVRSSIIPLRLVLESDASDRAIDSGVLIGGAGGGAAIIALLTGAVIFIVRSRAKPDNPFAGDADADTRTERASVVEPSSVDVEDFESEHPLDALPAESLELSIEVEDNDPAFI